MRDIIIVIVNYYYCPGTWFAKRENRVLDGEAILKIYASLRVLTLLYFVNLPTFFITLEYSSYLFCLWFSIVSMNYILQILRGKFCYILLRLLMSLHDASWRLNIQISLSLSPYLATYLYRYLCSCMYFGHGEAAERCTTLLRYFSFFFYDDGDGCLR